MCLISHWVIGGKSNKCHTNVWSIHQSKKQISFILGSTDRSCSCSLCLNMINASMAQFTVVLFREAFKLAQTITHIVTGALHGGLQMKIWVSSTIRPPNWILNLHEILKILKNQRTSKYVLVAGVSPPCTHFLPEHNPISFLHIAMWCSPLLLSQSTI